MSEFKLVCYKRRGRLHKKERKEYRPLLKPCIGNYQSNCEKSLERKIFEAKAVVKESEYYNSILEAVSRSLLVLGTVAFQDIICYGLGNFSSSSTSRHQLGLILLLKERFNCTLYAYDPAFSSLELGVLTNLGCEIILSNEEAKHRVSKITLVYLPHCPKQIINNFLWSNWGIHLSNCIILGNSLKSINESNSTDWLSKNLYYIQKSSDVVKEYDILNNFWYTDIFNDLALHIFPLQGLVRRPIDFWENPPTPNYSEEDIEFVTKERVSSYNHE